MFWIIPNNFVASNVLKKWSSSPTEIIFYELLHVLSSVEHPQLAADVWAVVELPDESVDVIPHNVYHSEQI